MFSTVFPKFKELYPDSSLQITEDLSRMLERLLSEKKINLAVISTDQSRNPDFHYDIIKKEEFVMVISPKHPGFSRLPASDEPIDLTLLKDFSFILTPNPTVRRSIENNIFSNYNFEPEIMCEINNITTIYQMISKNNGIAFIPEGYINTGSSNCYFRLTQHPHWELAVIYHKDYHPNNAEKEFISMVTDYYRSCTSYLSN